MADLPILAGSLPQGDNGGLLDIGDENLRHRPALGSRCERGLGPDEQPEPVVRLPLDGAEPREWNIWELDRLAHEAEGRDPAHDEELVFLLLQLRQFANADGQLPLDFDPVVRQSFGELIYAAV